MTDSTPVQFHATTRHNRRTYAHGGANIRLATTVEGAPFSRSDCWQESCRDEYHPYLTVKVYLSLRESVPTYVSATCHDELRRYTELRADARTWLEGRE